MSTQLPALFARLVDDAAVFPPGNAPLPDAVAAHRGHRSAWYADLVGPLLVPVSLLGQLAGLSGAEGLGIGLVGDTGLAGLAEVAEAAKAGKAATPHQIEISVAKRGEDAQPGLTQLIKLLAGWPGVAGYPEIPLSWGLMEALDVVAAARRDGLPIAPKFRTGGLAAELFPTPVELAAVICACRDRQLPFKLTAGLHRAIRRTDPETGFVHHGFLNILVAAANAAQGAELAEVAPVLAGTDPLPLVEASRRLLADERPLWTGFGSCSVAEPMADLAALGLLPAGPIPVNSDDLRWMGGTR